MGSQGQDRTGRSRPMGEGVTTPKEIRGPRQKASQEKCVRSLNSGMSCTQTICAGKDWEQQARLLTRMGPRERDFRAGKSLILPDRGTVAEGAKGLAFPHAGGRGETEPTPNLLGRGPCPATACT